MTTNQYYYHYYCCIYSVQIIVKEDADRIAITLKIRIVFLCYFPYYYSNLYFYVLLFLRRRSHCYYVSYSVTILIFLITILMLFSLLLFSSLFLRVTILKAPTALLLRFLSLITVALPIFLITILTLHVCSANHGKGRHPPQQHHRASKYSHIRCQRSSNSSQP